MRKFYHVSGPLIFFPFVVYFQVVQLCLQEGAVPNSVKVIYTLFFCLLGSFRKEHIGQTIYSAPLNLGRQKKVRMLYNSLR